jgi:hypothetical protein
MSGIDNRRGNVVDADTTAEATERLESPAKRDSDIIIIPPMGQLDLKNCS